MKPPFAYLGKVSVDYAFSRSASLDADRYYAADSRDSSASFQGAAGDDSNSGYVTSGTLETTSHLGESHPFITVGLCLNLYRSHSVCYSCQCTSQVPVFCSQV